MNVWLCPGSFTWWVCDGISAAESATSERPTRSPMAPMPALKPIAPRPARFGRLNSWVVSPNLLPIAAYRSGKSAFETARPSHRIQPSPGSAALNVGTIEPVGVIEAITAATISETLSDATSYVRVRRLFRERNGKVICAIS